MRFYKDKVFPFFLNRAMRSENLAPHRQSVLSDAQGKILELGFGTGANLKHYPEQVRQIETVEPNLGMKKYWQKSNTGSQIEIHSSYGRAEELPFPDNNFDTAVSTFTLCSVEDVRKSLSEIFRVLKPGGKFLFLEHGLAQNSKVAKWQNRLNGISQCLSQGCNLNRKMDLLILESRFKILNLEQFFAPNYPRTHGYFYKGTAIKP